jgi:hypothetical protein
MTSEPQDSSNKVAILGIPGKTHIWITAEILPDDLGIQFHGYDDSSDLEQIMGAREYEYWILVPIQHKELLLFALLKNFVGGTIASGAGLKSFLEENAIPHLFSNEIWGAGRLNE